jgi:hypothetical protein
MAEEKKISELPVMTDAATGDLVPLLDISGTPTTRSVTVQDLVDPLVVGRRLSMRPAFVAGLIGVKVKPLTVEVGAYSMYSMPIYAADNQELFWRLQVPGRWDGASDIHYYLVCALSAAETENDDFQFRLDWANTPPGTGVLTSSTTTVDVPQNCGAGHTAQYSTFKLDFTIVWNAPTPNVSVVDVIAGRVRRIASGGTEVSNNIYIVDHWLTFTVDKIFKI